MATGTKNYLVREENDRLHYAPVRLLEKPSMIKIIDNPVRMEIIRLLSRQTMYPAEIAKRLKLHEQVVYYHVKQLLNADILSVAEKKEIRGTIAKKLFVKHMNFALALSEEWKDIGGLLSPETDKKLEAFLDPFVKEGGLQAKFVVGSPDPHGPFKARARDSHYAIDLALFMGRHAGAPKESSVKLDVETSFETENSNLILVGGPVTNLLVSSVNEQLPVRFSEGKEWAIFSEKTQKKYSQEAFGIVAKMPNPHFPNRSLLILAGISSSGTKAAVLSLTSQHRSLLTTYTSQTKWGAVVQGFDIDGDGKIDSVEIIE
jgi:DNA-binding transcriptional ArsR family regulator